MSNPAPPPWVHKSLRHGVAIPAHPLALTAAGAFDERHQRALTRYYAAAGAGGVAVGVHTTQFAIRDPGVNLLTPVLRCAADTLDALAPAGRPPLVRVAGACGRTAQAVSEAELAMSLGYHAVLLSLSALRDDDDDALFEHCRQVARSAPLIGFYLQPTIGGRVLGAAFWRRFAQIENVIAIKIAPFDRYRTLDVVRGVAEAGRAGDIALYTGNDDNIVADLLARFDVRAAGRTVTQRIVGGLLGHWAVWTRCAVELLDRIRAVRSADEPVPDDLLALNAQVTDCNAAIFDPAHDYKGVIAGVHYVLHGQGLLASTRCLDPNETLSPGQAEHIDRVRRDYPHLVDDAFVAQHLHDWLN